jgi:uncharacterized protein with HEPN domain
MSFEPRDYLKHILAEADYLLEQSGELEASDFHSSETLKRAFVRSLEVIGEAVKKLPSSYRLEHSGRRLASNGRNARSPDP